MSLYDEFDIPKSKNDSWNAGLTPSINLMQAHVNNLRKASSIKQASNSKNSQADCKVNSDSGYRFNHLTGKMEKSDQVLSNQDEETSYKLGVKDEYNPFFPNDYEQLSRILQAKRKIEVKKKEVEFEKEMKPKVLKSDEFDDEIIEEPVKNTGVAIAPPPSLISDIYNNDDEDDCDAPNTTNTQAVVAATKAKYGTTSAAAKIMVKMGFQEGRGLGKEGQGMSMALQVEKTSMRQGKIIHEKDMAKKPTVFQEQLSNVVLLTNMVGVGEVDEDLQPETAEECGKYGIVLSCNVFELQNVPDDQSVRIFVEFADVNGASKAVNDLNGRYFGGRIVSAGFYDSEKFKNLELTDEPLKINDYTPAL